MLVATDILTDYDNESVYEPYFTIIMMVATDILID